MSEQEKKVGDLMQKQVLSVDMNLNAAECSKTMASKGVSGLVVTHLGTAVGIITERDVVSKVVADAVDPNKVLARDIMSTPLITVSPDVTVTEAASRMAEYRVRRLVVVDRDSNLVGIITAGDIARMHAERQGYADPTLNALARYKEGADAGPYR